MPSTDDEYGTSQVSRRAEAISVVEDLVHHTCEYVMLKVIKL